jgi:hypothetical protein
MDNTFNYNQHSLKNLTEKFSQAVRTKSKMRNEPTCFKDLTEKWKHPKKLSFPEMQVSSSIVRSAAHLAGQSEGMESLTTKFSQALRSRFEL